MNKTDKRIHIQHVVLSLDPGGLENGVVNIVNRLDPESFRSSIICLKKSGKFAERIAHRDVDIHEMTMKDGNDYWLVIRLARLLYRTRTDVVHTRNQKAFFYGFFAGKLVGVKAIVHSEHGREFPGKRHSMLLQRMCSRYTDAIVSMSDLLLQNLVKYVGIPRERIQVIYNGVDLDRFAANNGVPVRHKLSIPTEAIVIGVTGRLVPVKNYMLLLRATKDIGATQRVVLLIVGDGPERLALENYACQQFSSDSVRFVGYQSCVEQYLSAMDIYVLPSFREGISNTLLEAMAAGKPAVASRVGGNAEIITHGTNGLLFDSDNQVQLSKLLSELVISPALRTRLGNEAAKAVRERFSLDRMIAEYESLYRQVYAREVERLSCDQF